MMTPQVVIIGAGPAGIACALQLKRHGITPLLLERDAVGGLLRNANLVENYPGFPRGISGPRLVALFEEQLRNAKLTVTRENVLRLEHRRNEFYIHTGKNRITTGTVVLATGTAPRRLKDPHIPQAATDWVYYEIHPLLGLLGKTVAIIGCGDAALDYALNLSRDNKVIIINRGRRPKGLPLLFSRCMEQENISYFERMKIDRIELSDISVELYPAWHTAQEPGAAEIPQVIEADYLVIAIGREPQLNLIDDQLAKEYHALVDAGKLYAIGDLLNGRYRQTAICVGNGVEAAMDIAGRIGVVR